MNKETKERSEPKTRIGKAARFAKDYGGVPLVLGMVAALLGFVFWLIWIVWHGTKQWISEMEDPIERGLAYVTVAIILHAFLGRSSVDVKCEEKRNPKST